MKKILIGVATALGAVAAIFGWSTYNNSVSKEISCLFDITDTALSQLNENTLADKLLSNVDRWGQTILSIQSISDVDYNEVYRAELPSQFPLLVNPNDREADIDSFRVSIKRSIKNVIHADVGRVKSSVLIPIFREALRLSTMDNSSKQLLVFSDLAENTDSLSVYNPKQLLLCKMGTLNLLHFIPSEYKKTSLKGVEIFLIYKPTTAFQNEVFTVMSSVLRKEFEARGARVVIGANLLNL